MTRVRTLVVRAVQATLRKLQEGLYAMNWIEADIVPTEWLVEGRNPPRGPYTAEESRTIAQWVNQRD